MAKNIISVRHNAEEKGSYREYPTVLCSEISEFERSGLTQRWGVGYIPKGSEGRQEYQGPIVKGPWPFAYGLCTVIDNHGGSAAQSERDRAAGIEVDAHEGDLVEFGDGLLWPIIRIGWSKHHLGFAKKPLTKAQARKAREAFAKSESEKDHAEMISEGRKVFASVRRTK